MNEFWLIFAVLNSAPVKVGSTYQNAFDQARQGMYQQSGAKTVLGDAGRNFAARVNELGYGKEFGTAGYIIKSVMDKKIIVKAGAFGAEVSQTSAKALLTLPLDIR